MSFKIGLWQITLIIFASSTVLAADYKAAPCKAKGYTSETCLVKEFGNNEQFYAQDFPALKEMARKNPNLPWLSILDSNNSLVNDLSSQANSIPRAQRGEFIELVEKLKKKADVQTLLDATEIFLKANPSESFYLSNHDPMIMQKLVAGINGASTQSTASNNKPQSSDNVKRCVPDQKKYMEIMDDKARCGGPDVESGTTLSLYTALAEIAACEKYDIQQIGVVETIRYRSLSLDKPCVISLKGASASIGAGHIDIKSGGEVYQIPWDSGYDLLGKRNDLNFWRAQLNPEVEKLFNTTPSERTTKSGKGKTGTGR